MGEYYSVAFFLSVPGHRPSQPQRTCANGKFKKGSMWGHRPSPQCKGSMWVEDVFVSQRVLRM
jgi:hypothetical protein